MGNKIQSLIFHSGILIIIGLPWASAVAANPFQMNSASYCSSANGVDRVDVKLYPDRSQSPTFSLAFKKFKVADGNSSAPTSSAPTIVVIPGGPGETLLVPSPSQPPTPQDSFPIGAISNAHMNVIYTEPRGLGCNQLQSGDFPVDAFRSPYLAADIVSVIRRLQLDNYVIYGVSYGTVVATYATHLIESQRGPAPKALVLEGTFGHGVENGFDEYLSGFSSQWERVKRISPQPFSEQFSSNPLPFGYDSRVWGQYIYWNLITGSKPSNGTTIPDGLAPLVTNNAQGLGYVQYGLQAQSQIVSLPLNIRIPRIFQTIACQELFGGWKPDISISSGELTGSGSDICIDSGFQYKPYDSSQLQVKTSIFYFQGPFDPATPMSSARFHFENQTKAPRTFISVAGASHAPLSYSLRSLGCSEETWEQISGDPTHAPSELANCSGWKIDVQSLNPMDH